MAAHELDNKTSERMESRETAALSTQFTALLKDGSFPQLSNFDAAATIANNGFPQLELFDSGNSTMQADSKINTLSIKSAYESGAELTSDRELKQAGLNPKNIEHKITQDKDNKAWSTESTTVKYPNGVEVTVSGRVKHVEHKAPDGKVSSTDIAMDPEATVNLPKGFHKDKDGNITDANNIRIGSINDDGTVTMKVGKDYVTQSPAGVSEETVFESKRGAGMTGRLKIERKN